MEDNAVLEIGLEAFKGLLAEFREGNIADRKIESRLLNRHLVQISERWNQRFPGLPESHFPYSSIKGISRRGQRDKFLKSIIIKLLTDLPESDENKILLNPICVIGRHARDLALHLVNFRVIATDIEPRFNRFYKIFPWCRNPENFEFIQDDIFNTKIDVKPTAVVFFGACGSLTDSAIDYAIKSNCPYLVCRTCCYENIGGNLKIVKRPNLLNWMYRLKNRKFARIIKKGKGAYVSPKYSKDHYPQSQNAKELSSPDEFLEVSRNSVDSDICRTIIDLDRFLYLIENGYNAYYKAELFVAEK